jgi:hypothetical protein
MDPYWLFAFHRYYPNGGMQDLLGTFVTAEDARAALKEWLSEHTLEGSPYWRAHLLDIRDGSVLRLPEPPIS